MKTNSKLGENGNVGCGTIISDGPTRGQQRPLQIKNEYSHMTHRFERFTITEYLICWNYTLHLPLWKQFCVSLFSETGCGSVADYGPPGNISIFT